MFLEIVNIHAAAQSGFMKELQDAGFKNGDVIQALGQRFDPDVECNVWDVVETDEYLFDTIEIEGSWACITEYMIIDNGNVDCHYPCFRIV